MARAGRFNRVYEAVGRRVGRRRLEQLKKAPTLKPRLTLAWLAALLIAAGVHLLTVLLVLAAIISFRAGLGGIVLGLILLLMAWILRPRLIKIDATPLDRARIPSLYALADDVSASIGAKPIDGLMLTEEYNASYTKAGLRQRRYVAIGAPMFAGLTAQERAALLGHELGHDVNGDALRGLLIGSAINTLSTWYYVLMPDSLTGRGLEIIGLPVNVLLAGIAQSAYGIAWVLVHLLMQTSQGAEFQADHLAAVAGGTAAALSGLQKTALRPVFDARAQGLAINPKRDFFGDWRSFVETQTQADMEVRLEKQGPDARLDATHPPTLARLELLRARNPEVARVVVGASETAAIDAELAEFEPAIKARLADRAAFRMGQ